MGDSRSWAAGMESSTKTCRFGVVTPYFDKCVCSGCEALRKRNDLIEQHAKDVYYKAKKVFEQTPDHLWDTITEIKVK